MSGPKVDYAKLREQEMASLAEARGRRLKVADKIQKMINQIDSCLGGDVDLMLQDPQIGPGCKKIQELQAQYKKELQALYNTVKHGTELLDVDAILHADFVIGYGFDNNEKLWKVYQNNESMTNSNDILQIYQVFNLIMSQEIETKMYTEIPFEIDFADCIPCLLKKKNEFMNEMKNYNQNGFDKYRENIWDNIEKICRKSTLIQQCNM